MLGSKQKKSPGSQGTLYFLHMQQKADQIRSAKAKGPGVSGLGFDDSDAKRSRVAYSGWAPSSPKEGPCSAKYSCLSDLASYSSKQRVQTRFCKSSTKYSLGTELDINLSVETGRVVLVDS
jgi:hypothetical protein